MRAAQWFAKDLLRGDVALVTGGGTGIGRSIAIALAECGAEVVIASRSPAQLDEGVRAIAEATGHSPLAIPCDIREPAAVEALLEGIQARHGRIDGLVNNAGGKFDKPSRGFSVNARRA